MSGVQSLISRFEGTNSSQVAHSPSKRIKKRFDNDSEGSIGVQFLSQANKKEIARDINIANLESPVKPETLGAKLRAARTAEKRTKAQTATEELSKNTRDRDQSQDNIEFEKQKHETNSVPKSKIAHSVQPELFQSDSSTTIRTTTKAPQVYEDNQVDTKQSEIGDDSFNALDTLAGLTDSIEAEEDTLIVLKTCTPTEKSTEAETPPESIMGTESEVIKTQIPERFIIPRRANDHQSPVERLEILKEEIEASVDSDSRTRFLIQHMALSKGISTASKVTSKVPVSSPFQFRSHEDSSVLSRQSTSGISIESFKGARFSKNKGASTDDSSRSYYSCDTIRHPLDSPCNELFDINPLTNTPETPSLQVSEKENQSETIINPIFGGHHMSTDTGGISRASSMHTQLLPPFELNRAKVQQQKSGCEKSYQLNQIAVDNNECDASEKETFVSLPNSLYGVPSNTIQCLEHTIDSPVEARNVKVSFSLKKLFSKVNLNRQGNRLVNEKNYSKSDKNGCRLKKHGSLEKSYRRNTNLISSPLSPENLQPRNYSISRSVPVVGESRSQNSLDADPNWCFPGRAFGFSGSTSYQKNGGIPNFTLTSSEVGRRESSQLEENYKTELDRSRSLEGLSGGNACWWEHTSDLRFLNNFERFVDQSFGQI